MAAVGVLGASLSVVVRDLAVTDVLFGEEEFMFGDIDAVSIFRILCRKSFERWLTRSITPTVPQGRCSGFPDRARISDASN